MNALPVQQSPDAPDSCQSNSLVEPSGDLLTEIDLSRAGRGRPSTSPPVVIEVLRSLTPEDLPALLAKAAPASPEAGQPGFLVKLRHSHHQLARLIAQGTETAEISLITGYTPQYISRIQTDPQFAELVATYSGQRELAFIDVLERMKALGLSCLEELQERVALAPEKWSHREMMELAELLLIKSSRPGQQLPVSATANAAVSINVKFVKSDGADSSSDANMINVTPR
jgi:hypothetical protein